VALTPIQRRSIELRQANVPQAQVARRLGIDARTLRRWRDENPEYRALLETDSPNPEDLSEATPDEILRELLCSNDESIRLRALQIKLQRPDEDDHTAHYEERTVYDLPPDTAPFRVLHLPRALPPTPAPTTP
jgi:transposase-like protein